MTILAEYDALTGRAVLHMPSLTYKEIGQYCMFIAGESTCMAINTCKEIGQSFVSVASSFLSEVEVIFDWEEIRQHIVLVHAFSSDSVAFHYPEAAVKYENDPDGLMEFCLTRVLTKEGIIGEKISESDRPQIHWAWNQLVQPHEQGNWENAQFAILEPLVAFEQTIFPFGLAPYDTMTQGDYKLSKDSILLVPSCVLKKIQAYLDQGQDQGFQGKIISFDYSSKNKPIRKAIFDALNNYYPDVWHIANKRGDPIADKMIKTKHGYNNNTYLKTGEGQNYRIMRGSGMQDGELCTAMENIKKSGRFIGLHSYFPTNKLETSAYFRALLSFKTNPLCIEDKTEFIGHGGLGIKQALQFLLDMKKLDAKTKMVIFGEQIFELALQADITSLQLARHSDLPIFTRMELKQIASFLSSDILKLLTQIKDDRSESYEGYTNILLKSISCMRKAKEEINQSHNEQQGDEISNHLYEVIYGELLKNEWQQVYDQGDMDLDFEKRNFNKFEIAYIAKIAEIMEERKISERVNDLSATKTLQKVFNNEKELETKLLFLTFILECSIKNIYFSELMTIKEQEISAKARKVIGISHTSVNPAILSD